MLTCKLEDKIPEKDLASKDFRNYNSDQEKIGRITQIFKQSDTAILRIVNFDEEQPPFKLDPN